MVGCESIREEYRNLAAQERLALTDSIAQHKSALEYLDRMIELLKLYPDCFDDPEDRIRVQNFRISMLKYRLEREARGSVRQLDFLKEAAEYSTPSVCSGVDCTLRASSCSRWTSLSERQKKMCIEKINAVHIALKLEGALAARHFYYSEALEKRRKAASIHQNAVYASVEFESKEKQDQRRNNQRYLDYWQAVTESCVSLLNGDFDKSREWLKKTLEIARLLPLKGCFPNYFYDINEIVVHRFYIDAVEKVKLAKYAEARDLFQTWLDVGPGPRGYIRSDNMCIFKMICNILEFLREKRSTKDSWDELDDFVEQATVARTTWALLSRLNLLRALSSKPSQELQRPGETTRLEEEVKKISQDWRLFVTDSYLLDEDRAAGLRREVNYISFLDVFDKLDEDDPDWRQLLMQNMKHLFLIMADYEHLRYLHPPRDEAQLPRDEHIPLASEKMTIDELAETILFYLNHRSGKHAYLFRKALDHLENLKLSIKDDDFWGSIRAERAIFDGIRFWPHVIRAGKPNVYQPVSFDKAELGSTIVRSDCIRLWNKKPRRISFEGPQKLNENSYYYLRPKWNTRCYRFFGHSQIRHEQFLESNIPRLIDVFSKNTFESGKKTDPRRFRDWVLQFDSSERLLACRLFDMVRFYTEDEMREMWIRLYREKLPPETKIEGVAYAGLGHMAKSGYYNFQYHLRQGMSTLKENELSFKFSKAFRELSEYDNALSTQESNPTLDRTVGKVDGKEDKPHTVVFVDDFIGQGKQAIDLFVTRNEAYFKRHQWLAQAKVYYCALVGFREGINAIKSTLSDKIKDVLVLVELDERDKAFSKNNPCWKSEQERYEAEQWASQIGRQVLTGMEDRGYDPDLDNLGWRDSQALIVFHYNIPNNTLPIFWGEGKRNSKKWNQLWVRYD